MESPKRERKKREIIDRAIIIWSDSYYSSTSLTLLAKDLGCSKQAIYRYFPSKSHLLTAIEDTIMDFLRLNQKRLLDSLSILKKEQIYHEYIRYNIETMEQNREYFLFLLFHMGARLIHNKEILALNHQFSLFCQEKPDCDPFIFRYLDNLITFFELNGIRNRSLYEAINQLFFKGLWLSPDLPPSFQKRSIRIPQLKNSHENHLGEVINKMILEKGPISLSMSEIALEAGLSKSSLYSHYSSKEEMIISNLNKLTINIIREESLRLQGIENTSDRLEAQFSLLASLYLEGSLKAPMFHWFIQFDSFKELITPGDIDSSLNPLKEGIERREIDNSILNDKQLLMLIHFITFYQIEACNSTKLNKEQNYEILDNLSKLFLLGYEKYRKLKLGEYLSEK